MACFSSSANRLQPAHEIIEVDLVAVEIGSVDAGEFDARRRS